MLRSKRESRKDGEITKKKNGDAKSEEVKEAGSGEVRWRRGAEKKKKKEVVEEEKERDREDDNEFTTR